MKQRIIDTGQQNLVSVPEMSFPKSTFNLSHEIKTAFNFGEVIPVLMQEAIPGDVWHLTSTALCRMVPLLAPVMHRANLRLEYFFVPNHILWDNWENFISPPLEGFVPPPFPTNLQNPNEIEPRSLANYLGVPVSLAGSPHPGLDADRISMLPAAAYWRCIYDWYADENFATNNGLPSGVIGTAYDFLSLLDGPNNNVNTYGLLQHPFQRNNDRDRFTSALPWPQKGADVLIPVFTSFPDVDVISDPTLAAVWHTVDGTNIATDVNGYANIDLYAGATGTQNNGYSAIGTSDADTKPANLDTVLSGFKASTSDLTAVTGTINDLRTAASVQRWLELDNFGTKYIENIKAQYGVTVEDFRLNRCQYLGMTQEQVTFSEVLQTSETAATPQANMAGHGIAHHIKPEHEHFLVKEHGWMVVMVSVLPNTSYCLGLDQKFLRRDRLDYPFPVLANTGYEEIKAQEVVFHNDSFDNDVFGYVPRYNYWRTIYNRFNAEFATSLSYWQMSTTDPTYYASLDNIISSSYLNSLGIFADSSEDDSHLLCYIYHTISCERVLPKFSVPSLK